MPNRNLNSHQDIEAVLRAARFEATADYQKRLHARLLTSLAASPAVESPTDRRRRLFFIDPDGADTQKEEAPMLRRRPIAVFSMIILAVAILAFVGLVLLRPKSPETAKDNSTPTPTSTPMLTPTETPAIQFGDEIQLLSCDVSQGGPNWTISLLWKVIDQPKVDYSLSIQAIQNNGQVIAQADTLLRGMPATSSSNADSDLLTSAWKTGGSFASKHTLTIELGPSPDALYIVLYEPATLAQLSISQGGVPRENHKVMAWPDLDVISWSAPASTQTPGAQTTTAERQALVALYRATGGEKWAIKTGWMSAQPICSWYGVTCAQDQVVGLALTSNNLKGNLPPEIGQLTNLQQLFLNDNQLTELPPEIGQLTNLQMLFPCNNQLTELPPEISQLTNLQSLDLSKNQFTELPPEIGRLTNLQSLDLSKNQLTELPPEIGRLTNLQSLDLSGNPLAVLPPELDRLTSLQLLNLSSNQLTALPPEIGQLTSLQVLELSGNQLTALPPEIGRLTSLRELRLWNNQLTALPPEIGQLTSLQVLSLDENHLTELPPEIGRLTNLQSLELSNNQLTALPSEIGRLTNLQSLDLSNNRLMALPPESGQLTNLQVLRLWNNQLTALPLEVCQLPNLSIDSPDLCR